MPDDSAPIDPNEIEQLLKNDQSATPEEMGTAIPEDVDGDADSAASDGTAPTATTTEENSDGSSSSPAAASPGDDIDFLLKQAELAIASVDQPTEPPEGLTPFQFQEFSRSPSSKDRASLDLLQDVELDVKIELGRTEMYLEDVLKLRRGSVVALDKLAGDPVDIYVNGRLIARGEVLVLNDNFCVRVAELIAGKESE